MKNHNSATAEPVTIAPKYYEVDGALKANANKAWVLAFSMIPITLLAIGFAIVVRIQPPTIIGYNQNHEAIVIGKPQKPVADDAAAGRDPGDAETFVKKFLKLYLNYAPANADEHWSDALNMMDKNLRATTLAAMKDQDLWGKVKDDQIQSVFVLRELDPVPSGQLTYIAYGVKDVHRIDKGFETTDHLVNEYQIRLKVDKRSDVCPDGLWIAEYSERPIDGERRDRILAAHDAEDSEPKGVQ